MRQYIGIYGDGLKKSEMPASLLTDFLSILINGNTQVLRLLSDGKSIFPGTIPEWIKNASEIYFVEKQANSTTLTFEVPTLAEAAPEYFKQEKLFQNYQPKNSALSYLETSLSDVLSEKKDSDYYDEGLISCYDKFKPLFKIRNR